MFGWTADEPTSFRLLDAFVAAEFNLIDTADVYSRWAPGHRGGESETVLGKWFQRSGKRGDVILATKVGMEMGPQEKGLSKRYIMQAVERSLRRLQTDYIDLYQSHIDDPATPLEETLEAYGELIRQGKVRAIGASNYTAERLAQALEVSKEQQPADLCLPSAPVQPLRSRHVRRRTRTALPAGRYRSHPLLLTRGRFLDGEVSIGTGSGTTGARRDRQEVPERTRLSHPPGSRPDCQSAWFDTRPGCPCLASFTPRGDRADCQRDQYGTTQRLDRSHTT